MSPADAGAALRTDALIDHGLIRAWLAWGLLWLLVFPSLGVVLAVKFTHPGVLDGQPWLSFGRLRPVHVNGIVWGAFSTLFIGLAHYVVPRLCGVRLWQARWSHPLLWVWNLNVAAGSLLLLLGGNRGWEVGEYPLPTALVFLLVLLTLTVQFLVTIARRADRPLSVSLWYLIGAFLWTDFTLVLLVVGPDRLTGADTAAWPALFTHSIMGLWITPAGHGLVYYFLPASVQRSLYSRRLALVGFWWLAFVYPFVGVHHYLTSPPAGRMEIIGVVLSMMLVVPLWTVLQNVFGTLRGAWPGVGRNLPATLLVTGSLVYLAGGVQASVERLRVPSLPVPSGDFVTAHAHITIFGTFVLWALAGTLHVWPRIAGPPRGLVLATSGSCLVILAVATMLVILTLQSLPPEVTGHSVDTMRSYRWARMLGGVAAVLGLSLLVLPLARSVRRA